MTIKTLRKFPSLPTLLIVYIPEMVLEFAKCQLCMVLPILPELKRQRQGNCEFEASGLHNESLSQKPNQTEKPATTRRKNLSNDFLLK
jgi:hypothetical protein